VIRHDDDDDDDDDDGDGDGDGDGDVTHGPGICVVILQCNVDCDPELSGWFAPNLEESCHYQLC
jgi:hypothetical protein